MSAKYLFWKFFTIGLAITLALITISIQTALRFG